MSLFHWISCDGPDCNQFTFDNVLRERPHVIRARLKVLGWRVGLRGGRDLCPECAAAERRGKEG